MKFRSFLCHKLITIIFSCLTSLNPVAILADCCGESIVQLGGFTATQGKSQHVDIEGLIGDDFSIRKHSDQNLLVGAGYYFNLLSTSQTRVLTGINAFYLAPTKVKGEVTQENLFTNLSYQYRRSNFPIYFATKALINFETINDELVIDLGIGLNIVRTHGFKEKPLFENAVPDQIFSGKTNVAFSVTAGLGWRFNQLFENFPFEINYRFFYLGKGKLKKINDQVINTLHTGNCYANAFFFTIII